jgi:hypothetical protein
MPHLAVVERVGLDDGEVGQAQEGCARCRRGALLDLDGTDVTLRLKVGGIAVSMKMGAMLDARLVGYWSDEALYLGAMEAADIAFRPDGNGWAYWSRDGGAFFVLRFSWHTAEDGQLALDLHERLSGSWDLAGRTTRHRVTSQRTCNAQVMLCYQILAGQDISGRPATLLEADQPISRGTIGDRFAFKRGLAGDEQDPATGPADQ